MNIIGREYEKDCLNQCLKSKRAEFVVVYGRRRVGKTYLIREYFNRQFSFYTTGLSDEKTKGQLRGFLASLNTYGDTNKTIPCDWFEAFERLKNLLINDKVYREPLSNKRIVFLDELPWMDTPRSNFKSALDYFWNSWACYQDDLILFTCGSATSWIISNLLIDKKGFYNRVTRSIHLSPFSLFECEKLLNFNGIVMTRNQIIEAYMIFGGIPYYLNLLDSRLSLTQNVNEMCFKEYGYLYNEYYKLFYSLYDKPNKHLAIIRELSQNKTGLTRAELASKKDIGGGSILTKDLRELEECDFIRKYNTLNNEVLYQLIDPFVLFHNKYLENKEFSSWNSYINTPDYNAWRGNGFEIVCLHHIKQIKASLGIQGIETKEFTWRNNNAQIDLIIKRKDGVTNLCEMKYTNNEYSLDKEEHDKLLNRLNQFQAQSNTSDSLHLTLICGNNYIQNKYSDIIQNIITGEELFKF